MPEDKSEVPEVKDSKKEPVELSDDAEYMDTGVDHSSMPS